MTKKSIRKISPRSFDVSKVISKIGSYKNNISRIGSRLMVRRRNITRLGPLFGITIRYGFALAFANPMVHLIALVIGVAISVVSISYNLYDWIRNINKWDNFSIRDPKKLNFMGKNGLKKSDMINEFENIWLNFSGFYYCKYNLFYNYKKYGKDFTIYGFKNSEVIFRIKKFNHKYTPKDFSKFLKKEKDVHVEFKKGTIKHDDLLSLHVCRQTNFDDRGIYVERTGDYNYLSNLCICDPKKIILKKLESPREYMINNAGDVKLNLLLKSDIYYKLKKGKITDKEIGTIINLIVFISPEYILNGAEILKEELTFKKNNNQKKYLD
jgi:hypothetical protein